MLTFAPRGSPGSCDREVRARFRRAPGSGVRSGSGRSPRRATCVAAGQARLRRTSTTWRAMTRYVVSLPPVIVTAPDALVAIACSRDAARTSPVVGMSGRMPGPRGDDVARASGARPGRTCSPPPAGIATSASIARTSSGDASVNVSVVPMIVCDPAGSVNITRPSRGCSRVTASRLPTRARGTAMCDAFAAPDTGSRRARRAAVWRHARERATALLHGPVAFTSTRARTSMSAPVRASSMPATCIPSTWALPVNAAWFTTVAPAPPRRARSRA